MDVFFSGTDMTEILDNSAFHNYYVSLIVNNVNNMTAKVAYRMHRNLMTTDEHTYNDINGVKVVTKEFSEQASELVLIYDCDILKPFTPDAATRSRFCQIRDAKSAVNAERQKQFLARTAGSNPVIGGTIAKEKGLPTPGSWAQKQLMAKKFAQFQPPASLVPGNLFDATTPEGKIAPPTVEASAIRNWMIDLLGQGKQNDQLLSQVLQALSVKGNTIANNIYLNDAFCRFVASYWVYFEDDTNCVKIEQRINTACIMLQNNYSDAYGPMVHKICKKLKQTEIGQQ